MTLYSNYWSPVRDGCTVTYSLYIIAISSDIPNQVLTHTQLYVKCILSPDITNEALKINY